MQGRVHEHIDTSRFRRNRATEAKLAALGTSTTIFMDKSAHIQSERNARAEGMAVGLGNHHYVMVTQFLDVHLNRQRILGFGRGNMGRADRAHI